MPKRKTYRCKRVEKVQFCPDTEGAYTEMGKDGKVWRGGHKGFDITVYPVSLINKKVKGWEYTLYNEKKDVDWDSLAETSVGGDHAKTAKQAMEWAKNTVEEWE